MNSVHRGSIPVTIFFAGVFCVLAIFFAITAQRNAEAASNFSNKLDVVNGELAKYTGNQADTSRLFKDVKSTAIKGSTQTVSGDGFQFSVPSSYAVHKDSESQSITVLSDEKAKDLSASALAKAKQGYLTISRAKFQTDPLKSSYVNDSAYAEKDKVQQIRMNGHQITLIPNRYEPNSGTVETWTQAIVDTDTNDFIIIRAVPADFAGLNIVLSSLTFNSATDKTK